MTQAVEGRCIPGCGACCDPVMLAAPHFEQARLDISERDRRWMLEDLVAMPFREGVAKTAWMGNRQSFGVVAGRLVVERYFYRCRQFDADTRVCMSHDDLPSACSGYPWHGEPHPNKAIPPQCGYNVDVGREPVPVTLSRKPG